jgi:hypothetical protein
VRYYKSRSGDRHHWTVETRVPGQPDLHTHQVKIGSSTQVLEVGPKTLPKNPTSTYIEPLPNPGRARAVQEDQLRRGETGEWVQTGKNANSCATAVCEVVSAGGGKFPWKPQEAAAFLRKLFNLPPP